MPVEEQGGEGQVFNTIQTDDIPVPGRYVLHTVQEGESVAAIIKKTGKSEQEVIAQYVKDVPMGRLIQPHEVAAAVLYLCSPDAGAVTGTTLTVAGGEI